MTSNEPAELSITYIPLNALSGQNRQLRRRSKKFIRQLADSIQKFGFLVPVVVNRDNKIVLGHGRVEAAKLLGLDSVPTVSTSTLTEEQVRALRIAENKLGELSEWDQLTLKEEFTELSDLKLDFDLEITGFTFPEIEGVMNFDTVGKDLKEDETLPVDRSKSPISKNGDLWLLGQHKILCADALLAESYEKLLSNAKAQMVLTDPPYNCRIEGNVSGLGAVKHKDFVMASGELSDEEFRAFLRRFFQLLVRFSAQASIHYVFMDYRQMYLLQQAAENVYSELKQLCVWVKSNGGMGSFYRQRHELIFVFKNGPGKHINNFALGQYGRSRTNVWEYAGMNSISAERSAELALHPTCKPVALLADAMRDCSKRGGIILDPFAGSGTTVVAAEIAGRDAYAIELDPHYVDTSIRRWQKFTGEQAVNADTGRVFDELQSESENVEADHE
ncbi:MAG: DNA methyltransferase [Rhodospirillaceae bacterium]|nr:DNA methyltransferase [Rhodospirillaceae bacterium]